MNKAFHTISILTIFLVLAIILSCSLGAVSIPIKRFFVFVFSGFDTTVTDSLTSMEQAVLLNIRLPRIVLGILVGAALGISGACMQGLFRNPLADPGLIGVSAGGGLFAALVIVTGLTSGLLGSYSIALMAFLGAGLTTLIVYKISTVRGKTAVATMLLAGIAISAFAQSATGFLMYISDDAELRDLTFWMMGSLGNASWKNVCVLLPFVFIPAICVPFLAKELNLFSLGETEAQYSGVNVKKLKLMVIGLTTMAVGASVAMSGMIGFIGLIVPHFVRMAFHSNYKILIPASMILGAAVLVLADLLARTLFIPSEIPLGIVTAFIGTPVFLSILIQKRKALSF